MVHLAEETQVFDFLSCVKFRVRYVSMIVDDLFPGSLGLPRWRTFEIPDPGVAANVKIPT